MTEVDEVGGGISPAMAGVAVALAAPYLAPLQWVFPQAMRLAWHSGKNNHNLPGPQSRACRHAHLCVRSSFLY